MLYLQSQDGNVYRSYERDGAEELVGLRRWVKRDVEWMRDATGESSVSQTIVLGRRFEVEAALSYRMKRDQGDMSDVCS